VLVAADSTTLSRAAEAVPSDESRLKATSSVALLVVGERYQGQPLLLLLVAAVPDPQCLVETDHSLQIVALRLDRPAHSYRLGETQEMSFDGEPEVVALVFGPPEQLRTAVAVG